MCNGDSHGRVSQGGTLAVLRPVLSSNPRPQLRRELSLRLSSTPTNSTIATLSGLDQNPHSDGGYVLIHRDGDLRSERVDPESVLHCLEVPGRVRDGVSFGLGRTLDLGVGGEGVIGRRVSFVEGGRVVGQGIMGWN